MKRRDNNRERKNTNRGKKGVQNHRRRRDTVGKGRNRNQTKLRGKGRGRTSSRIRQDIRQIEDIR